MGTGRYELRAVTFEGDECFNREANELIAQGWELESAQVMQWHEGNGEGMVAAWHCIFRRWYPTGVPRHEEEPHKARERERLERLDPGPGLTAMRARLRGSVARERLEGGE